MGGKEYHVFPSKKICLTKSKFFVAEPLCFTNFLVSKKFLDKERGGGTGEGREYHDFLSNIFLSQFRKVS